MLSQEKKNMRKFINLKGPLVANLNSDENRITNFDNNLFVCPDGECRCMIEESKEICNRLLSLNLSFEELLEEKRRINLQ